MDTYTTTAIAAQRINAMRQQAAKSRLVRQLRTENEAADRPNRRVRIGWLRPNPRGSHVVAT